MSWLFGFLDDAFIQLSSPWQEVVYLKLFWEVSQGCHSPLPWLIIVLTWWCWATQQEWGEEQPPWDPGNFFSYLRVHFKYSQLFPSHTENLQGLTLPHCIAHPGDGSLLAACDKAILFCVGKLFLTERAAHWSLLKFQVWHLIVSERSGVWRNRNKWEDLITAAAWEVGGGQLQGSLFPCCISAPTARDSSLLFSFHPKRWKLRHSPKKPIWRIAGQHHWHTASHSTSPIQKIYLTTRTLLMGSGEMMELGCT